MDRSECKGCLWIDLDERIRRETFPSEGDKVPAAGGVWTILEVQNFAKKRLRRTTSDHSQSIFGMNWVIIQKNSSDLGHFILTPWR